MNKKEISLERKSYLKKIKQKKYLILLTQLSLLIGFLIYALFLIFASIGFMAGHNAGGK